MTYSMFLIKAFQTTQIFGALKLGPTSFLICLRWCQVTSYHLSYKRLSPDHHTHLSFLSADSHHFANRMDRIAHCADESMTTITTAPPPMESFSLMDDPKDKDSDSISVSGSSYSGMSYMDDTLTDRAGGPARSAYADPVVAEEEERQVKRSRLVVIAVLIVSLAILASTMYLVVSRGEHETFEKQVSLIYFRSLIPLILLHPRKYQRPPPKLTSNCCYFYIHVRSPHQ
jgi:hypothetical protein